MLTDRKEQGGASRPSLRAFEDVLRLSARADTRRWAVLRGIGWSGLFVHQIQDRKLIAASVRVLERASIGGQLTGLGDMPVLPDSRQGDND